MQHLAAPHRERCPLIHGGDSSRTPEHPIPCERESAPTTWPARSHADTRLAVDYGHGTMGGGTGNPGGGGTGTHRVGVAMTTVITMLIGVVAARVGDAAGAGAAAAAALSLSSMSK